MAIQAMAMPVGPAAPRPAGARPAEGDRVLRDADLKGRGDSAREKPEDTDFADVHAGLALAETEPARDKPLARPELAVAALNVPTPSLEAEPIAVVDVATEAAAEAESPLTALIGDASGADDLATEAEAEPADAKRAPQEGPSPAPRDPPAASAAVSEAMRPAPDLARADAPDRGAPTDARSAPRTERAGGSPMPARTDSVPAQTAPTAAELAQADITPKAEAPADQPKNEAAAAAETTARRAEAALDRRSDTVAASAAAPPDAETVQAVRAAPQAVAVPQDAPKPGLAEARIADGEKSVAAAAEHALKEADALGLGAGPAERAAAAFSITTPATDRAQAAATMAQIAPTLRKGADGTTEIRLDPPELGRVRLTLRTDENGLVATVLAERPETMDLMRRNADMLLRDLAAGGQTRVDLSFGSLGAETAGGGQNDDDAPKAMVGLDRPTRAPGADLSTQLRQSRAAGGLDIRV